MAQQRDGNLTFLPIMTKLSPLQTYAESLGGRCLSDKYNNKNTKYQWRCAEGHIWEATWSNVGGRAKSWCPKCWSIRRSAQIVAIEAAGEATCLLCKKVKVLDDFPKGHNRINGKQRYSHCKPCHSDYQRASRFRNFFNLSIDDYDLIWAFQGGVCYICKNPPKKTRLAVDHDHKTGLVRGLLCPWCNRAIGQFRDMPERIKLVFEYFFNPPATQALGAPRFGMKGRSTNKVATVERINKTLTSPST